MKLEKWCTYFINIIKASNKLIKRVIIIMRDNMVVNLVLLYVLLV